MTGIDPEHEDEASVFEDTVLSLRKRMRDELNKMDSEREAGTGTSETRMKSLAAFLKALQGVEEMANGIEEKREQQSLDGIDIVELRRQLEKQIEALVDEDATGEVS